MIICFGSINLDLIFPLPTLPLPGQTVLGAMMKTDFPWVTNCWSTQKS